ncbi:hypothetical protein UK15_20480 [Streptomyces variegatus]|uniref:Uncharacterized protein n=1 Tax=Streptomyces variegatus TaxID=284040 RepID=A0A0M2GR89_9ACTN|nr:MULTISPECIES: hypothetical protein [Streptomyces]KJK37870.1 hypothetical protein UK15_20480 [Streptomyces variegatus]
MDALTELNVLGLILSAVLLAMACVKADRVRAWRAGINPSAEELSDASFIAARVALVALAGVGIYLCVQGFRVSDDTTWDDTELTTAVQGATDALDGSSGFGEIYAGDNDTGWIDEYATKIEQEVVEHGGGDAPQYGVTATPAAPNTASEVHYTVTGADSAFCMQVTRTRSKDGDYEPPGIAGGEGTVTVPSYDFAVTTHEGGC